MVDYWHISGDEMIRDPGLLRLRHYLPVLALINAPYAGAGSSGDPTNPLDPVEEWRVLARTLEALPDAQDGQQAELALARLLPPTVAKLRDVLAHGEDNPDAFRVAHIIAQGEHDTLLFEDADGGTQIVGAESFAGSFAASGVRVVLLDGCFSQVLAELLVERGPVQAVIGTRRKLAQPSAAAFNTAFYAALCDGQPVRDAFRVAIGVLKQAPGGGADRYEIVVEDDDVTVPLPEPDVRAAHALLLNGQPRRLSVPGPGPDVQGFVGRRETLAALADALPDAGAVVALHGPAGVGKTWIAEQVVERFGWRFPDGVVWLRCNTETTDHGILAQIARLLEPCAAVSPLSAERGNVLKALRGRRVLVVLDDLDMAASDDERARILHAMRTLCAESDSRVIVTARALGGPLAALRDGVALAVERFNPKAARTLAMRLAVNRGLDVLDVDTIDDFLERTQGLPWLVATGIRWVEQYRFKSALERLGAFPADDDDPLVTHIAQELRALGTQGAGLRLLRRAARLPEAFDRRLAIGLAGDKAEAQLTALVARGLLLEQGDWYVLPPLVRQLVNTEIPLNATHRAQVDRVIMLYLMRTWPPALQGPDRLPSLDELTPHDWARLANARALLRQPPEGAMQVEADVMARLLVVVAPMLRAAGLSEECNGYARAVLHRMPADLNADRIRVLVVLAATEDIAVAGPQFEQLLALPGIDPALVVETAHTYGRALLAAKEHAAAGQMFGKAFAVLRDQPETDLAWMAAVLHDWARALRDQGRDADAIVRYREALAAYARLERPGRAAAALHELGAVLVRHASAAENPLDTLDRADDLLRRALGSAEQLDDRALAARIRLDLADLHVDYARALNGDHSNEEQHAEWSAASDQLRAARLDCAVGGAPPESFGRLLALSAAVDARRGMLGQAGEDAQRSADVYARAGFIARGAESLALAGRLWMAHGDSIRAQSALHGALDLAAQVNADDVLTEAAAVLVRVHHIRVRHAQHADAEFAAFTREQAHESRARLETLGLAEHATALERVLAALA